MNSFKNQKTPYFQASIRVAALMLSIIFSFVCEVNAQFCGSVLDLDNLRRTNHEAYKEHLRIEKLTADYQQKMASNPNARLIDEMGVITIPVVFHVLHRGESEGTGTNIPTSQIISQMAVLNACYSQTNDQSAVPQDFRNAIGKPNFRFELACTDPNGNSTTGILRKSTTTNFLSLAENIKYSASGGDDAWPTNRFLNVWVAPNLDFTTDPQNQNYGYAHFPNILATKPNEDGAVVRYDVVGVNPNNAPGFTAGHALVHEIGHWLNVLHTFQGGCNDNDQCLDTPPTANPTWWYTPCSNISHPYNVAGCGVAVMYDNFMDYTNDNCGSRMFTKQQVNRMRAVFQAGGPRRGFIDNYFKLYKFYQTCTSGLYFIQTPFCNANGNINWNITGPATTGNFFGNSQIFTYVTVPNDANGEITLTASWENFTDEIKFKVGYGEERSFYNFYYPYYNYGQLRANNVHYISYNSDTYGQLSFADATGQAKNWQLLTSSSSQTSLTGNGNNFTIRLAQPYAFARIRADIPTACGDRTVEYSFYGAYGTSYTLSPNPTSNEITISASAVGGDPNNRTSSTNTAAYEVQIFNAYNQLLKKTKVHKGNNEVTINVSNFPSNQFYTVKLISDSDVQTKSFFKQ